MTKWQVAIVVSIAAALSGCANQTSTVLKAASPVRVSYVSFQTLDSAKPLTEAAILRIPTEAPRPMPAVVIVHGSSGVDSRGNFYATALNNAGIATLEIDMWSARGLAGGTERPKGVPLTLPDAYGAFKLLAANPAIDAKRIG
ncbi:MAG: hypothetical protein ABL931_22275, partial [Usitatibacteraceae bacterium]